MAGEARRAAYQLVAEGFRVWAVCRHALTPLRAGFARAAGPGACAALDEFTDETEVGVLCGPCPAAGEGARFVCVDYDGDVPDAARIGGAPTRTSKGGAHAWYRIGPDVKGFRQTQAVRKGPGWAVDTRDFGGYARETKGGELLWDNDLTPRDLTQAEVEALFGKRERTEKKKPAGSAPSPGGLVPGLEAWDRASLDALLADPTNTNDKAGHLGAMLAQHHWTEDDARSYCVQILNGQNARHVESAVSAFRRVRNGEIRWNGAMRLQGLGLRLLGESAIETARPLALRRNDKNIATPWFWYGGEGYWLAMSESEAEAIVHVVRPEINALPTAQRNRARAEHLRDHRRYNMPAPDTDPLVLNVRNGLVDLRTGELSAHDPAHYCTRIAGARYDDTIDTSAVEALMLDWCGGDGAMAEYAWSLAGEAALGRGKRAFTVCYGPPGTGKSCLTQLVMTALGSYATSVSPETWLRGSSESERQEQLSRTVGARLIASPELPGGRWHPIIKAFTSGGQDTVSVAGKWQKARDVRPTGLIWLTGNEVPEGADAAMRSRALFLPLTRTYERNQRWADDVLPTYVGAALVCIVRAAVEAYKRGGPLPMPVRAAEAQAEQMAEPFVQWLAERAEPGEQASARDLWLAWERSKGKNDLPNTETGLGKRLKEADLAVRYPWQKTNKGNIYTGLRAQL
jgi:phage/plasmid-associated DNA primase